jgi:hypothetical protein
VISTFVLFVGFGQQRLTLIEVIATYALTLVPALILAWLKL